MLYDTLFAIDEKLQVKPQMVDNWETSADGLTWTFTLRDGPRIARRHAGDLGGLHRLAEALGGARFDGPEARGFARRNTRSVDARTFQIVLKQKFGPLLEAIGKPSVVVPFILPKKAAETRRLHPERRLIGSGPFIFKKDEWKPGEKLVYVKNPKYKPRPEPMSGLAGGKVVKLDRVEWVWIPDAETQLNALVSGEIDMLESVDYDHLPMLEKNKDVGHHQPDLQPVRLPHELAAAALQQREGAPGRRLCTEPARVPRGQCRRQALLRTCKAMFTCGTPLAPGRHGRPDRGQRRQGRSCWPRPATTARWW